MEDGVWRTIRGRRVFIKEGQSLSEAMRNSGKFELQKEDKVRNEEKLKQEKIKKVKDLLKQRENVKPFSDELKKINEEIASHYGGKGEAWEKVGDILDAQHAFKDNPKILNEILGWKEISKSPYSDSFYNSTDIGWGHKPEGSLRIADHWNFTTKKDKRKIHCKIKGKTGKDGTITGLKLGKYVNGKYEILEEW